MTLEDANVSPDTDPMLRGPQTDLHVVEPSYISISVDPFNNWNVILDRVYSIRVEVFDRENNRIFGSDNLVVKVDIPDTHFKVRIFN